MAKKSSKKKGEVGVSEYYRIQKKSKRHPPHKIPKRMSTATIEQTLDLFELYREGKYSVRELSRNYNISFSTLRDRFRNLFGINYTDYRSGEGTVYNILREHIDALSEGKHKTDCLEWFERNKERLLEMSYEDSNSDRTKLYTGKRLDRESQALCRGTSDVASSPFLGDESLAPVMEDYDGSRVSLHGDSYRKSF